jgi:hypothetical protein
MREVGSVGVEKCALVSAIGIAYCDEEGVGGPDELCGIDEFFRNLVDVATRPFDGCPAGLPAQQEEVVVGRSDNLVEVLEDEQELGKFIKRVEAVPELGPMAVLREHPVAEAVDRGHGQFGEVARIADLARAGGQPVSHLEGGLLGEGAEHKLPGLRLLQQQEVQCSEDDAVGLAGARTGDHQQRAVQMTDDRALSVIEVSEVFANCRRDSHLRPACHLNRPFIYRRISRVQITHTP